MYVFFAYDLYELVPYKKIFTLCSVTNKIYIYTSMYMVLGQLTFGLLACGKLACG